VTNFTSGSSVQQLAVIIQMGVLAPFCDLLGSKDWRTVVVVMDGLNNIMQVT
jgi:importin subunit alpha-2